MLSVKRLLFRAFIAISLHSLISVPSFSQSTNPEGLLTIINDKQSHDTTRILAMTELAYAYWTTKPDSTILLANQSIKLSNEIHFAKGLARAYGALGVYHNNLGNSTKALAYYDTALTHANEALDSQAIGRIYNGLGNLAANSGDYEKALNYHFRSLKIKEAQNDIDGVGNSNNNIGNIYFEMGNYSKALDYGLKSLAVRKKEDQQGIAASQNNIALIYDKLGDETKSMAYFFDALNTFRDAGVLRGITYSCHDIAQVYIRQKKYDKALEFLKEGLQAAETMKSAERISDFKVSFAQYYNAIGEYPAVFKNAQEAIKLARQSSLLAYERAAYKEMAFAAFHTGQFKQAYMFQERFAELNDSIQNENKIEKALQEEFNFKESKNKLEQEKKELVYQNTVMKQRWLLYGAAAALIALITIAFSFYKSSKIKKKSSDLLAIQKDELAAKNELIVEQNKLLQEAKSQLEQKIEERTHDLRISNKELANQNLVMEQFSFMTAHNLRGPVARLMGLSSLFNHSNIGEPFNSELMKRIQQSSADLDEVIHDITAILHIKSGIQDPFVNLNVKETLDKILYQLRETIEEKNIVIQYDLDPHFIIRGILAYVQSVFYNVISNSVKYYDHSRSPEIKIHGIQHGNNLIVTIVDNGIGFDSVDNKEKLFRPFTRFSTVREGKGLGLYLIKIQMESMGGTIEIESKINVGTSVILTFCLPQ